MNQRRRTPLQKMKREETIDYHIRSAWHAISRMYNQRAQKYNAMLIEELL